jgi:transcriptional regulator with XRE-family HTH domain
MPSTNPRMPDPPVRLNAPLILALKMGAGIDTTEKLAHAVGVDKSQLGRALKGQSSPSVRMLHGLATLFPLAPYHRLVVLADRSDDELAAEVGMTADEVTAGWAASDQPPS